MEISGRIASLALENGAKLLTLLIRPRWQDRLASVRISRLASRACFER